jgi:hypothetical protein
MDCFHPANVKGLYDAFERNFAFVCNAGEQLGNFFGIKARALRQRGRIAKDDLAITNVHKNLAGGCSR